jgi:voltage-gated potassium channel
MNRQWEGAAIRLLVVVSAALLIVEVDIEHMSATQRAPGWFLTAEIAIASLLTLEIVVRMITALRRSGSQTTGFRDAMESEYHEPSSLGSYLRSPEFLIDLLAVIPFWISLFTPAAWFGLLRAMRVLRLLKFYRYSPIAHRLMCKTVDATGHLAVLFVITTITALLGAVAVFELEHAAQPDAFSSIGNSLWWMVVTMTTVGYGDISPETPLGKAVAVAMMPFSLAIMGAIIGIVGGVFQSTIDEDTPKSD